MPNAYHSAYSAMLSHRNKNVHLPISTKCNMASSMHIMFAHLRPNITFLRKAQVFGVCVCVYTADGKSKINMAAMA